jgi:hypothetical protein
MLSSYCREAVTSFDGLYPEEKCDGIPQEIKAKRSGKYICNLKTEKGKVLR